MKNNQLVTILLLIIGTSNYSYSQNILTGLNAPAYGVKIKANFSGYTGGWSRGFRIVNEDDSKQFFSLGAMGEVNNGRSNFSYGWIGRSYGDAFMYFKPNGYVGIGTRTPSSLFEINKNNGLLQFKLKRGENEVVSIGSGSSTIGEHGIIQMFHQDSENIRFYTTGDSWIKGGNLGIGTSAPKYKLDVLGTIRARELKVDMQGADFVFEESYPLRPISELEDFVKANKHLPEIAPAKEMQENGVNQSEMNQKLLQKIEELTLYVIDLNKKVIDLQKENQVLKNETKN